jgi:hypothetical protein
MSTGLSEVFTPNKRKRNISVPDDIILNIENTPVMKKKKTSNSDLSRECHGAAETIIVADVNSPVTGKPDFDNLQLPDIAKMIYSVSCEMKVMSVNMHRMNTDMRSMVDAVYKKIDAVEKNVNQRIKDTEQRLSNNMDRRFNKEITLLKKLVEDKTSDIYAELNENADDAKQSIEDIQTTLAGLQPNNVSDISLNIVIRNVSETRSENVIEKVNNIISEGMKSSVKVTKAERKGSTENNNAGPRVIVATLANKNDKSTVMKKKSLLRNIKKFEKVYIHNDQTKERIQVNNLKKIIDSVKHGNTDNLELRGSRVILKKHDTDSRNDTDSRRNNQRDNRRDQRQQERRNDSRNLQGYRPARGGGSRR